MLPIDPTVGARFHYAGRAFSVRVTRAPISTEILISITCEREPSDPPGDSWILGVNWPDDQRISNALDLDGARVAFLEAGPREGEALYQEIRR